MLAKCTNLVYDRSMLEMIDLYNEQLAKHKDRATEALDKYLAELFGGTNENL